jgi:hypothetical protein
VLGESWQERGDAPDWRRLYDRREVYRIGVVPPGGLFLPAGADIQKDRIEVEVVAWGRGKETWSVDYRVLEGDTSRQPVWGERTQFLGETFPAPSGVGLPIVKPTIDCGYAPTEVYGWAKQQGSGRVVAVKVRLPCARAGGTAVIDRDWAPRDEHPSRRLDLACEQRYGEAGALPLAAARASGRSTGTRRRSGRRRETGMRLSTHAYTRCQAEAVLAQRQDMLTRAYQQHPERFVRKPPEPIPLPKQVWINKPSEARPTTEQEGH